MSMASPDNDQFIVTSELTCDTISLIEDSNCKKDESSGKCPICLRFRKYFHCADCVRNGDFTHSKNLSFDRFADKKLKKYKVNEKLKSVLLRYEILLSRKIKAENLKRDIAQCRERISYLRECIKYCREQISKGEQEVNEVRVQGKQWAAVRLQYAEKLSSMEGRRRVGQGRLEEGRLRLAGLRNALKELIRRHKEELLTHIFPITKLQLSNMSGDFAELEEARQTTWVGGRWVGPDAAHYRIVEPCIPGSGDYAAAYTPATATHGSGGHGTEEGGNEVALAEGRGIGAALAYATHLVSVMAFYLDAHLPKHLTYSEFCGAPLERGPFLHRVAKLNANVVHLCLTQGVEAASLRPHHTLPNLLLLLTPGTADLGCCEVLEVDTERMIWLEDCLCHDLLSHEEEEENHEDDFDQEWVKVSEDQLPHTSSSPPPQASFMASVASLWRAATSHK